MVVFLTSIRKHRVEETEWVNKYQLLFVEMAVLVIILSSFILRLNEEF